MLKKTILIYGLLVLAVCGRSEAADLTALLAELKLAAAQTGTLDSDFRQEKHLAVFSETLVSQGRFVYEKPDSLRWELLTPVASGFVLQGKTGWRWNRLSQESGVFSVDKDPVMGMIAQQLLAWARVDTDWLTERYRMELEAESPVTLKLIPLETGEAAFIDHLKIVFAEDRSHVAEVSMVEQGGDSTLLKFNNVRVNAQLPADVFAAPGIE